MSSPSSKVDLASLGGLGGFVVWLEPSFQAFSFGNMGMILECL